MARSHQSRRPPSARIAQDIWEGHKPILEQWYVKEGLALTEVMERMKTQRGFEASSKQYRYRLSEKWNWPKYGQNRCRSSDGGSDSDSDISQHEGFGLTQNACLDTDIAMGESVGDLASSGSEYDNMNNIDIATLPQDFILAFSEIYPPIEAGFQKFAEATNHDQILSEVVQKLRGSLLHTDDSIDIIAYHRLSFEFGRAIGKLHESNSETQGQVQDQSDDEAAFKLEITNQPWYQDLNEQSEVYKCVWSCFYWCRDQLLSRPHRSEALLDFDTLGLPDTGDELNTFKQDACLFTYLFDLWFSQMFTTPLPWTQLSKRALRIPPTIMLHTMSSLILTWAGKSLPQQHRSSQSSSWDFNALLDFVQSGVGSIEEKCKMKRLIVEFISEFVFIHELPGEEDSDEEQKVQKFEEQRARIIAEEYIKQRFPVVEFPFVDSTGVDPLWDSDTFGFNGIMEV